MKVNQDLEMKKTPPFKIIFSINDAKNYTESKGQDVLTHLFPMHPFSTSWKHQKVF